jgi:peroxiredoxin Q/BCP
MMPVPGTPAPDFTLLDQDGVAHTLSAHQGTRVLLYFYPKDDTPGCTKQACALRDAMPDLASLNAIVFGLSPDSVKSHKKFAEKYGLPFTLLADEGHAVADAYGVWGLKKLMGREYDGVFRTSFLVDRDGNIETIFEDVKPERHAEDVLAYLRAHA